jgi:chemotaxis protein methyltransferase CheR
MLDMKQTDFQRLAQIVREETGNKVQEKNYPMLESRLRNHILKLGFEDIGQYWDHFGLNEKAEREILKSMMTTHYTFFFREFVHFENLEKWIDTEAGRLKARYQQTKEPVRIWSAACSRGQEVYSLAMFLEQALVKKLGVPYEITGSDIDQNSVDIAKNGVYPIQEVNTIPQMYLTEHWRRGTGQIKDYAAVHPSLKAKTRFQALNLLEMNAFNETFDVIFCRNVFIYFTDADVKKIAMSLAGRLKPGGFFASGISEPIRFQEWPLKSVGPSVYRKVTGTADVKEKTATVAAAKANVPAPALAPTYRVLCVDDSPVIQKLIEKVYGGDPMCSQVEFAANGEEARKMLDSKKFDVITLDIHMPVCGGIEFLERLYNLKNDPPVLMVSSVNRTDIDLATKSISLGAFDYIEKPAMNKLAQSSAEILTKTQMALRAGKTVRATVTTGFDQSIGQKIVVPDASQCARLVVANEQSLPQLEAIVRGQKAEYRSPALVIVHDNFQDLDKHILQFSPLSVTHYRGGKFTLHPNAIYLVDKANVEHIVDAFLEKSVSMQVLHDCGVDFSAFKKCRRLQLLVDESASTKIKNIEHSYGLKISDVTPATSFASLSLEYFAKLRKAA